MKNGDEILAPTAVENPVKMCAPACAGFETYGGTNAESRKCAWLQNDFIYAFNFSIHTFVTIIQDEASNLVQHSIGEFMKLLELQNIRKYYATQKAVDDISFSIEEGSIFGLLGPNGAGKTTLLRMITGIFFPDSGEITFNGKKFEPLRDSALIGYMPEERGLYKKMKIGEQALYLARLKGLSNADAQAKVKEWFIKFEMQSWWNKKVEDLSKGMSQKLQFVTTVLHNPKLVILDEPFSGLDPVNANLIKEEIFKLAQTGSTIIFSTHRMEQVEEICDHIILLNKGKKILDGTVNNVKQHFKENLYQLGATVLPEQLMTHFFEVIKHQPDKMLLKLLYDSTPNDVLKFFINQGVNINSFNEVMPSLNDIFIRLVEGTDNARQFQKVKEI